MKPSEVRAGRQELGYTQEQLADKFGVTSEDIQRWEAGATPVPRQIGERLNFHAELKRYNEVLDASGLPQCEWVKVWETAPEPSGSDKEFVRHLEALETHAEACATCQARDAYAAAHLPPLPELPMGLSMRVFVWLGEQMERFPPWLRPAVFGAVMLVGIVTIRALFALPFLLRRPSQLLDVFGAVTAAGGAGAVGGLVYSATRPALRRLGRPGDYLTGIVAVLGYMGALVLAAPYTFGENIVEAVVFLIVSVFFGLVIGHSWLREEV